MTADLQTQKHLSPTLVTVAKEAKVSKGAVSHILNGRVARYSEAACKRVLEAAARQGYRPHRGAQALRKGRSNLIGVVHFGSASEVASQANLALAHQITARGYDHMAVDLSWHGGNIERALEELILARVEGVAISLITEAFGPEHTALLAKSGIPVVSVNGDQRVKVPVVCDDVRAAFAQMTRHLLGVGHQKLLLLLNTTVNRPTMERMAGFKEGLIGNDVHFFQESDFADGWSKLLKRPGVFGGVLQLHIEHYGQDNTRATYEVSRRIFTHGLRPDALMCTNDAAAFGVYTAALEKKVGIPEDMALTGYGNDRYGAYPPFALTTIDPDVNRSSAAAIELLINHIQNPAAEIPSQMFEPTLVLRSSCGQSLAFAPELHA